VGVTLGCALAGCTQGAESSPTPTIEPSVIVTPTPSWTDEEQGAIDAVQRYLEVWTGIGQDIEGSDWEKIGEVAAAPAVTNAQDLWVRWAQNDWHLVGAPSFTATLITPGAQDHLGNRYHVYGCYDLANSHLVDSAGKYVVEQTSEIAVVNYLVLRMENTKYLVLEDSLEGETC